MVSEPDPPSRLERSIGSGGAIVVGLSAMIGTGVFAVWQPALDRAGPWLVLAVCVAASVAALNAMSTARLAARHPQAGGVYVYGRIYLGRGAGVLAGSVFVVGKTASAAAAALTIGVYAYPRYATVIALGAVAAMLALDLRGLVRSVRVAAIMVLVVIAILLVLAVSSALGAAPMIQTPGLASGDGAWGVLSAAGLIFVAFAGYARVTVLGEEVRRPARTIPRAMAFAFVIVTAVYLVVASTVVDAARRGVPIGPAGLSDVAEAASPEWLPPLVTVAAVLAAGAVLLSLIAGVGRTLFAMADSGDAPRPLARLGRRVPVPYRAQIAAASVTGVLVVVGGLTLALSVSAAMILTYYSIAHLAAMRLPGGTGWIQRAVRITPYLGIAGCGLLVLALIGAAA